MSKCSKCNNCSTYSSNFSSASSIVKSFVISDKKPDSHASKIIKTHANSKVVRQFIVNQTWNNYLRNFIKMTPMTTILWFLAIPSLTSANSPTSASIRRLELFQFVPTILKQYFYYYWLVYKDQTSTRAQPPLSLAPLLSLQWWVSPAAHCTELEEDGVKYLKNFTILTKQKEEDKLQKLLQIVRSVGHDVCTELDISNSNFRAKLIMDPGFSRKEPTSSSVLCAIFLTYYAEIFYLPGVCSGVGECIHDVTRAHHTGSRSTSYTVSVSGAIGVQGLEPGQTTDSFSALSHYQVWYCQTKNNGPRSFSVPRWDNIVWRLHSSNKSGQRCYVTQRAISQYCAKSLVTGSRKQVSKICNYVTDHCVNYIIINC